MILYLCAVCVYLITIDVRRPYIKIKMEIYHILNRGVDKRKIFLDEQDYFRGIHDLYEFNDINKVNNLTHFFRKEYKDVGRPYIEKKEREMLVDILAFCFMPNHYHLLVTPRVENGVSLFMKKFNGGYAKYFNTKYKRDGALFQGRYKKVLVKTDAHFIHLPYYIHLNPLDMVAPEWRDRKIKDYDKAIKFLESYRWSSHPDYLGKENFPSVTNRTLLLGFFGGEEKYKKSTEKWIEQLDIGNIKKSILE